MELETVNNVFNTMYKEHQTIWIGCPVVFCLHYFFAMEKSNSSRDYGFGAQAQSIESADSQYRDAVGQFTRPPTPIDHVNN